jgi:2-iminobutanoate/2-iminopropanoate deaminase
MTRRTIRTEKAPAAIGPYSQGVVGRSVMFTSMQIALDPVSGELVGSTAAEQVRRCLQNVAAIVEAAGGTIAHVVKTTIYMTDIAEFGTVNDVYAEFFPEELPARGVVGVTALPRGALIAVEAVADVA